MAQAQVQSQLHLLTDEPSTRQSAGRVILPNDELVFEIARDKKALEKAYQILKDGPPVIGVDSETGGFIPQKHPLWSIQFSNYEYSVVVPFNHLKTIGPLQKLLLDKDIIKVFHNGKFDLKFLHHNGIEVNPESVADTMIQEKLLKAGVEFVQDSGSGNGRSLKALASKYLGYEMSKEERSVFYDGTFYRAHKRGALKAWTSDIIDYTLDDVWVLVPIYHEQQRLLKEMEMGRVSELENRLVSVVARMEYLGIAIDAGKAEAFGDKMQAKADIHWEQLRNTLEPLWQQYWRPVYSDEMKLWLAWEGPYKKLKARSTKEYFVKQWRTINWERYEKQIKETEGKEAKATVRRTRDGALHAFVTAQLLETKPKLEATREEKPFQTPPKERGEINITSNQQLQAALAQAGVHLANMQKVTLEDMAGQNEVLDLLLDFRKYEKLAKYRTVILEELNDETDRVHPDINQIVSTGRFSISKPPLQQIPAKSDEGKELRSCFIAPVGRRIVAADYSAIELVIIGALSEDESLLEAIRKQDDADFDLHAWTMSKFLKVPYEELMNVKAGDKSPLVEEGRASFEFEVYIPELNTAPDMQTWFKRLRDVVKTLTYGIAYGLSEFGLARKFHMNKNAASQIIDLFYEAYPGVQKFIDERGKYGIARGFSATPIGRRRFYLIPQQPNVGRAKREVIEELQEEGRELIDVPHSELDRLIQKKLWALKREREYMMAAIRRQAANMPIQGASADMTKLAMVLYEERTRHFPYEDFLRLTVHDELLAEVGVERAEEAARILETSMMDAAYEFLPDSIPVKAEAKISTFWDK